MSKVSVRVAATRAQPAASGASVGLLSLRVVELQRDGERAVMLLCAAPDGHGHVARLTPSAVQELITALNLGAVEAWGREWPTAPRGAPSLRERATAPRFRPRADHLDDDDDDYDSDDSEKAC